jgi:hypothetical protein
MMNPSVHSATSGSLHTRSHSSADNDTVFTPTCGERAMSNEGMRVGKRSSSDSYPPETMTMHVHPANLHAHWMNEVKSSLGDTVQFLDNRNCPVGKLDPLKTDSEVHSQNFQIHYDRQTT